MIDVPVRGGPSDGGYVKVPTTQGDQAPVRMVIRTHVPGPPTLVGGETEVCHDYRVRWTEDEEPRPYFHYDGEVLFTKADAEQLDDGGCPS